MWHEINRINIMESVVLLYSGEHIITTIMPFFSKFARTSAQSSGIRRAQKNGAICDTRVGCLD
jgi:hypothetical protein